MRPNTEILFLTHLHTKFQTPNQQQQYHRSHHQIPLLPKLTPVLALTPLKNGPTKKYNSFTNAVNKFINEQLDVNVDEEAEVLTSMEKQLMQENKNLRLQLNLLNFYYVSKFRILGSCNDDGASDEEL